MGQALSISLSIIYYAKNNRTYCQRLRKWAKLQYEQQFNP